jgi:hypothetical protein
MDVQVIVRQRGNLQFCMENGIFGAEIFSFDFTTEDSRENYKNATQKLRNYKNAIGQN